MRSIRLRKHRTAGRTAGSRRARARALIVRAAAALPWLVSVLVSSSPLEAQEAAPNPLLPAQRHFADPIADPREPRFGVGLAWTDLFRHPPLEHPDFEFADAEDAAIDVHGTAAMGATLPLWQLARWPGGGGMVLTVQAGVAGRFRMEKPSRDEVATDWMVALPLEAAWRRLSGRLRLLHRSSHLGDELMQQTGARHLEFSHEAVDLLVAYDLVDDVARVYGGGAFIFRSNTEQEAALEFEDRKDNASLQLGADGAWFPWSGGRAGIVGGIDWQRAQRTGWRDEVSAAAGVAIRNERRSMRLVARYFRGPSPLGEFFLTPERFLAIELVAGTSSFP